MENLDIRQAESAVLNYISHLPYCLEIKRLIAKDVYERIRDEADKAVDREFQLKEQEGKDVSTENVQQD